MSYCAVYLNRIHREKNLPEKPENPLVLEKYIPIDADFTFVDFVPSVLTYSSKDHEVEYHRFSHLVEAANSWIRKNPQWNIINCETVLLAYRHNVTSMVSRWEQRINPTTPLWSPTNRGEFETVLKALRLWIQRKDPMEEEDKDDSMMGINEQKFIKLKYLDFIPKKLNSNSDFETIDDLVMRVNNRLKQYDTFHWNIITVESLKIESNNEWMIDPEMCLAEESAKHLTILRLHYGEYYNSDCLTDAHRMAFNNSNNNNNNSNNNENNSDTMIVIGIEDFKPKLLSAGSFFRKPELEPFSTLIQRASTWLNGSNQSTVGYFLNAQSINIRIKSLTKLKTKLCTNTENGDYVQFLRIVFYKFLPRPKGQAAIIEPRPRSTEPAMTGNQSDVLRLCSKVFVATKLDHPLDSMQQRIYNWLHTDSNQNICMLSAETIDVYAKDDDEKVLERNCGECFIGNRLGTLNTYTFKAIRLYYYLIRTELLNNRSKCYNSISYSKTFPLQKQKQNQIWKTNNTNNNNTNNTADMMDSSSGRQDLIQSQRRFQQHKDKSTKEVQFSDEIADKLCDKQETVGLIENLKLTPEDAGNRSTSCNCM